MVTAEEILAALEAAFADRDFVPGLVPDPIATFPAAHPAVGDLRVWLEGDEATVEIGRLTHTHVTAPATVTSPEERSAWVVRRLVEFLRCMFDDRVEISCSPDGMWTSIAEAEPEDLAPSEEGWRTFLWSGPVEAER